MYFDDKVFPIKSLFLKKMEKGVIRFERLIKSFNIGIRGKVSLLFSYCPSFY